MKIGNARLDNHTIFIAVFFMQLTAIIAQGSLRASFIDLVMQLIIWGALLGFSLSFAWSYIHKEPSKDNKLPEQLSNIVAMFGLAAFFYQIVTSTLTSAVLLMLSWLLIAMSLSFKKQRNLYFSLFASTTLLLYAASMSKSSSFIVYITIFTLAAVIALAANFYLSKTKQQISSPVDDYGFPFKRPITVVAGVILMITSVIYLLVPRPAALHWGIFPAGGGRYQAKADWPKNIPINSALEKAMDELQKSNFDQDILDKLKQSGIGEQLEQLQKEMEDQQAEKEAQQKPTSDAFKYPGFEKKLSINDPTGSDAKRSYNQLILFMEGKEPQYLRGNVYDYFDGLSWKKTKQDKKRVDRSDDKFVVNGKLKAPFELYTVTLAADLAGEPSIFTPPSTAQIQFPSNAIAQDNYGVLSAPKQIRKGTFYSIKVATKGAKVTGRPVDNTSDSFEAESTKYTQLPKNISNRFVDFSKEISRGSSGTLEIASKIEAYLRKNYEYSLESVYNSQGKIPLEAFLFEKPLGHCEYFATAMVTLMRAQHIPARFVTGFSVTSYNPLTGYYEARGMDAHAWAEVWVPDTGWVTFEATPAYALPKPSEAQNTSQSIEEYLQKRAKDSDLIQPNSLETTIIHAVKRSFEQFNLLLNKAWSKTKSAVSWTGEMLLSYGWLIALIAIGLFIIGHYLSYYWVHWRLKRKLRTSKKEAPKKQLHIAYQQMEQLFKRYKHPRLKEWTLTQYQNELNKYYPMLSKEICQISAIQNESLYQDKEPSSAQLKAAVADVEKVMNHSFAIPIPAEKPINALAEFIRSLSLRFSNNN